jgi:hypothetical protein
VASSHLLTTVVPFCGNFVPIETSGYKIKSISNREKVGDQSEN